MSVADRFRSFEPAVLATALATFVAFLGIGVVDPVLPEIAGAMGASHVMVELLFTSYILVIALSMLVSGALATRIGSKRTMVLGLGIVAVFAGLCGLAPSVEALALLRGVWGMGNALFTTTALAIMVGASARSESAITFFEAALGLGIAGGPLVGGFLGAQSWRFPFFATGALMTIAFGFAILTIPETDREQQQSVREVLGALGHPGVLTNATVGLLYSFGFFVVLAYAPLAVDLSATELGLTFFAWGTLVAVSSIVLAPRLSARFGAVSTLSGDLFGFVLLLGVMWLASGTTLVALVVVSGLFCGIANATLTTLAMDVSEHARPVSSAAFNSFRFMGAAFAPVIAGYVGSHYGATTPFLMGAVVVGVGLTGLLFKSEVLRTSLGAATPAYGD